MPATLVVTHKYPRWALDCHLSAPCLSVLATLRLGVRIIFEAVDNTRDAVFDERHLKVDQQAQSLVSEAKIYKKKKRKKQFLVNWSEKFHGLHFYNNHLVLDNLSARNPASMRTFS